MHVDEAIRKRRSIRSYLARPIEEQKLQSVLEAGRLAPSASNRQEWRYVVVKNKSTRESLSHAAYEQTFVAEAPVVIVACAEADEHRMGCGQLSYPIDVAISVDHMTLKAVEEGLGTCWIGAFDEEEVKRILNIPKRIRVVALLPLGYPKRMPLPTMRRSSENIICYDQWSL